MSNVIAFEPDRKGRAFGLPRSESAEILFFTGVRYVRDLDLPDAVETEAEDGAIAGSVAETVAHDRTERLQA